jgi:Mrp family chromosome partitioning ATPase
VLSAGGSCNGSLLATRRVNLAATLNAMGHKVRPMLVPPRPILIVNRIAQGTYFKGIRGLQVGILDADVYGPSLPTLINPPDSVVRANAP